MATYALIVELSLDTVRFSLLSWEKFDLCLDTRDELRSKFLRFVHVSWYGDYLAVEFPKYLSFTLNA